MDFLNARPVSNKAHPGRQTLSTGDETRTVGSAKDDSDINIIVKRMSRTGGMVMVPPRVPTAGDFSEQVTDYHTAMNMLRTAQDEFAKLDPKVRYRFGNDPQKLMDFMADPQNNEESYKLGLRVKPKVVVEEPIEVRVVNPAGSPTETPSTPGTKVP